ncbi:hypothetical protein B0T14DRAFT_100273 [Immersiella caudata]|uniref:Uncharacterized protein n=1 Tax=Immersiella caudata TaxID=314043 RepID=A0AA40C5L6_9PEZI|nr:hypothetical protein B0T14DRAFT_100273 [Immersiella caudata]
MESSTGHFRPPGEDGQTEEEGEEMRDLISLSGHAAKWKIETGGGGGRHGVNDGDLLSDCIKQPGWPSEGNRGPCRRMILPSPLCNSLREGWVGAAGLPALRTLEQAAPSGTPPARPPLPAPPLPFAVTAAWGASSLQSPSRCCCSETIHRSPSRRGRLFQMQGSREGAPWNGMKGGRITPHEMGHGEGRIGGCQHMGFGSWI